MLRDHFQPESTKWDRIHGQWPSEVVRYLNRVLPPNFAAAPNVHLGKSEVDVASYQKDEGETKAEAWTTAPTLTVPVEIGTADEYEIQVMNRDEGETLVAVIELVSPSNKDRPEHRATFASTCADFLTRGVNVVIVDVVTNRSGDLLRETTDLLSTVCEDNPPLYASSSRIKDGLLETWLERLAIGEALPSETPLWITPSHAVKLDLQATYTETLSQLRM